MFFIRLFIVAMHFCCSDNKEKSAAIAVGVEWTTGIPEFDNLPLPPFSVEARAKGPQSMQSASTQRQSARTETETAQAGELAPPRHFDRQPSPRPIPETNLSALSANRASSPAEARRLSCLSFLPCFKFSQPPPKPPTEMGTSSSVKVFSPKLLESMSLSQFEVFLVQRGIPVELFGINDAKSLKELWVEASTGTCALETRKVQNNLSEATLQQTVATVVIELRAKIHGEDMFLLTKDVTLDSGVKRTNVNGWREVGGKGMTRKHRFGVSLSTTCTLTNACASSISTSNLSMKKMKFQIGPATQACHAFANY